jgi:Fe-Mn family superoxide dismutase
MKKALVSSSFLFILLLSCRGGNDLEEVQIPDPEVETTQTAFGNPAEVKVNEGGTFKMKGLTFKLCK